MSNMAWSNDETHDPAESTNDIFVTEFTHELVRRVDSVLHRDHCCPRPDERFHLAGSFRNLPRLDANYH